MPNTHYTLQARQLAKKFNATALFKDISFTVRTGESFSVTGPNGSGKSTLLKILAGIIEPTTGSLSYEASCQIPQHEWNRHIGYTGPLVNPYEDLTALENIHFASRDAIADGRIEDFLARFSLSAHREKKARYFSSGMKQRLKIIIAALNDPPVLILDEPGTNLDAAGKSAVYSFLDNMRKEKIIILATNDPGDEQWCGGGIRLG